MRVGNTVFQFYNIPQKPEVKQVKNSVELTKELKKLFPRCNVIVMDYIYTISSYKDVENLTTLNLSINQPWVWDTADCDNLAWTLKDISQSITGNMALGFAIVPGHALNIVRCSDQHWYWIDNKDNKHQIFPINGVESITKGYWPNTIIL
jgi:hypothetical protein